MELITLPIDVQRQCVAAARILGLRFAKPIHELATAAGRIKEGDLSVRAPATTQDEVGLLARNFNQMAEELEQQVRLHLPELYERCRQRRDGAAEDAHAR